MKQKVLKIVLVPLTLHTTKNFEFKLTGDDHWQFRIDQGILQVYNKEEIKFFPLYNIRYFIVKKTEEANNA